MNERKAAALLKQRFEAAGCKIEEHRQLDEHGVRFEIDGYDAEKKIGYEYITEEAGDGWDVDGTVIDALDAAREAGQLYIFVVDESDAPDEAELREAADDFLAELKESGVLGAAKPAKADKAEKADKPKAKPKPKAEAKPKAKPADKKGKKR